MREELLLAVAFGLAALGALHRAALWAEARGLIYYRRRGTSGALGNALLEVQAILEPSKRHVIEERVRDPAEDAESGDPPSRRAGTAAGARPAGEREES
jgi:hypothetical protein